MTEFKVGDKVYCIYNKHVYTIDLAGARVGFLSKTFVNLEYNQKEYSLIRPKSLTKLEKLIYDIPEKI